jgi:hypothetical protein
MHKTSTQFLYKIPLLRVMLVLLLIFTQGHVVLAQSRYMVWAEQSLQDGKLYIDMYIQKTEGEDFALGSSNFAVTLPVDLLDVEHMRLSTHKGPSKFGRTAANNRSYGAMTLGGDTYASVNIIRDINHMSSSKIGSLVTAEPSLIASVEIPVKNYCGVSTISWITEPVAINDYDNLSDIKAFGTFIDPAPLEFSEAPDQPEILSNTEVTICEGETYELKAEISGNLQWFKDGREIPGAVQATLVANKSGLYQLKITNCIGSSVSAPVRLHVNPLPAKPVIFVNGANLQGPEAEKYQWYLNNSPIAGATSQSVALSAVGTYQLEVSNGCGSVFSDFHEHRPVSQSPSIDFDFKAYPNPYVNEATLNYALPRSGQVLIEVFTSKGDKVTNLVNQYHEAGVYDVVFSASRLRFPSGMYYLILNYEGKKTLIKLIELR